MSTGHRATAPHRPYPGDCGASSTVPQHPGGEAGAAPSFPSLRPPLFAALPPSCDEVTIFDFRALKPDVGTGLHHGSLYHPHEPPVDLTHLNRARRHKLHENTHESQGSSLASTPALERLRGEVPGFDGSADVASPSASRTASDPAGKCFALPWIAKPRALLAKQCLETPGALSPRLKVSRHRS